MSEPVLSEHLTPGKLLGIGDAEFSDWERLSPLCADPDFEGCVVNTGPLNLLAAATVISKAERKRPTLQQLVAFDYLGHGWRWFYMPRIVAGVLELLAQTPRTSRWLMNTVGADGRSQVAVARWAGVNIITVPISEADEDGRKLCMWRIARPIAFGSTALSMMPAPLSKCLPPVDAMEDMRAAAVHEASLRRIGAAKRDAALLKVRGFLEEPTAHAQGELPL